MSEWPWPHFTQAEMACKGEVCGPCGGCEVSSLLMDRLEALRFAYGKPLTVTSGYRCPKHNAAVSSTGNDGPHVQGVAVDLAADGAQQYQLLRLALGIGFTGIGVGKGFLHLDVMAEPPRPNVWSY